MTIFLTIIHVIACLILILVILLQVGRGHGLSGASLSGGVQSVFGVKAGSFLAKATTIAGIVFIVTTITLDIFQARRSQSLFRAGGAGEQIDMEKMKAALEKIKQEAQTREAKARASVKDLDSKKAMEEAAKAQTAVATATSTPVPTESK